MIDSPSATEAKWVKLSPWSVLHFAARAIGKNVQLAYLMVPTMFGASFAGVTGLAWVVPVFAFAMIVCIAALNYRVFSYRILASSVQVKQGFFVRKQLDLPVERIQNVNFEDPFYFRPLGLVTIKIDGAGAAREEVYLAALTLQSAELIRRDIIVKKGQAEPAAGSRALDAAGEGSEPVAEQEPFFSRSLADLVIYGLTNNRAFLLIGGFFAFLSQSPLPINRIVRSIGIDLGLMVAAQSVVWLAVLFIISFFMVMGVIALLSVLAALTTYFHFRMYRTDDALTVRRGLLTRHETHIRKPRIQVVSYLQDWLAFLLGRRNVILEQISHGVLSSSGTQQTKKTLIPAVALRDTSVLIDEILPGVHVDELPFTAISKRYFHKQTILTTLLYVPAALAPVISDLDISRFLPFLLLLWPLHIVYFYMKWKRTGLAVCNGAVIVRSGIVGVNYQIFPAHKVQKVAHVQSLLMQRRGLSDVAFHTAASTIRVPYLNTSFAKSVVDYCLYRAESDARSWM